MKLKRPAKSKQATITGVCGAKTRGGGTCQHPAGWGTDHPGIGRCKLHGGATPRGMDSPHFRHGAACRYLVGPDDLKTPVADEELVSAREEVVAAIAWAEKLCKDPGPKPPLTVLAALKNVVDLKQRHQEMRLALLRRMPLSEENVAILTGILLEVLSKADVPEKYRAAIAQALKNADSRSLAH